MGELRDVVEQRHRPDEVHAPSPERLAQPSARVTAVALRRGHHFSKTPSMSIRLLAGLGVDGDGHCGATVKHRSRVRKDPNQPNLRQVHLIHAELFDELAAKGFRVTPADLGENVTTSGVELLALPTGTRLALGDSAVVEITGLRNPCVQIDQFQQGLMAALLDRDADGGLIRKAGVMAIVLQGGEVRPGDPIEIEWPAAPHWPLRPV
uniref:MOSC domain containing protein n=1 Tax=Rhodopseudomonas palustris (strain BisA53) TaxID=316055 RepID=Q07R48_RHOP5